jgi:predicted ATPase
MITTLGLKNFKAFASAEIPTGRYTLLSGLNSTGKSTVLHALALLRQSNLDRTMVHSEFHDSLMLNGELIELGSGQDALHENYLSEGPDADPIIGLSLDVARIGRASWQASYLRDSSELQIRYSAIDPMLRNSFHMVTLFNSGFQYLRADRINPAVTFPKSRDRISSLGFLGTHGEYTVDFLRQRQDDPVSHSALHHPAAASARLLDQVEAWMSEVCPGVKIQPTAIEQTDLVRLSFQFTRTGQPTTNPYRPTNVGFGLTYVLPVVLACLTAQPNAMLLLENPEAHLHPRGQSAMARLTCAAAASGAQLVVETHSDHVLNGVRLSVKNGLLEPDDVVLDYFSHGETGVEIINPVVDSDGMVSQWPAGFFDEWDHAIDKLLD